MPVPVRLSGEPVTGKLPAIVTDPVDAPAAVGLNREMIVQLVACSAAPHVPPVRENGEVTQPNSTPTSSAFGSVTKANVSSHNGNRPRVIQLSAKVNF